MYNFMYELQSNIFYETFIVYDKGKNCPLSVWTRNKQKNVSGQMTYLHFLLETPFWKWT